MKTLLYGVLLIPSISLANLADLSTTWSVVSTDDSGETLETEVQEYRVYNCGETEPLASVPGDTLEYLEEGRVTSTGVYCREVTAYITPFEGARTQATVVVVVPGQSSSVQVQALPRQ
jgi:hypothetical protein